MSKELTEAQKKEYVEDGGGYCPYCKSHSYEGGSLDFEAGGIYQSMHCVECGETWVDAYHLGNVLE
jgi:hypothetical protein